jgi:16S rRNA (uracil1498-N3)-methyltransferase
MLVIATAIPKGPRAEAMVDQLAQLGVDCLIPLQADHGVVKPGDHKLTRFEKIAITAMKQSVSPWLMRIDAPATLDQVLENRPKRCLILDPGGRPVLPVDGDKVEDMDELILLIGPEGGWSERELAAAEVAGVGRWKISDAVLRIETAAVVAAGLARYLTGTQQEPSRG